jgi:O-antigen ligase
MIEHKYFRGFLITILVLFPGVSNLYKGAGSGVMVLLSLVGMMVIFQPPRPSFSRVEKWLMGAFAAYLAIYLLSAVINSLTGVLVEVRGKHFEKEAYLLTFIPLCFLFRRVRISRGVMWWGVALGAILVGCYSMIDFGWIDIKYRVRGAYNPIMFGCLSLTMAFITIQGYRFFCKYHPLMAAVPLAGFFLGMVSSILTGSRGAWIAVFAFIGITIFHLGKNLKRMELAFIIGTFCMALFVAYAIPETGVAKRFHLAQNDLQKFGKGDVTVRNSVGLRLASWQACLQMVKHNRLLGIGPGNYRPTILAMSKAGTLPYKIDVYHTQPHSIYLAVLVDSGVIGLAVLLCVLFLPVGIFVHRIIIHRTNDSGANSSSAAYAGLILAVGYIHFGLTETIFGRNLFVAFYVIMLSMLLTLSDPREKAETD